MLLPLGLAHIERLLCFSSLFFPRLMSAAADDDRSVQVADGMPKIPTLSLSLSNSDPHFAPPPRKCIHHHPPGGYRLQPVQ